MTIALDVFTGWEEENAATDYTLSHAAAASIDFVVAACVQGGNQSGDNIAGVTYGGETMTEVTGSPNSRGSPERSNVHVYILGLTGQTVPGSTQDVVFDVTATGIKQFACASFTLDSPGVEVDTSVGSGNAADPSDTLSLGGETSYALIVGHSGHGNAANVIELAGWTDQNTDAYSNSKEVSTFLTYDTIGSSDVTIGWTQSSEDYNYIGLAFKETVSAGHTVEPLVGTLQISSDLCIRLVSYIRAVPAASPELQIAATAPERITNYIRGPPVDDLLLDGPAPSAEITHIRQTGEGSVALSSEAPSAEIVHTKVVPADDLLLGGDAPSVGFSITTAPGAGELQLDGVAPSAEITHNRATGEGSLTLTGVAPEKILNHLALPNRDQLQFISLAPTLAIAHNEVPGAGALVLASVAPTVDVTDLHTAQPGEGSLALTGVEPSAEIVHTKEVPAVALALTGVEPTIVVSASGEAQPPAGSLVLTGVAPSAEITHIRQTPAGSLALTGAAPDPLVDHIQSPDVVALTLTGAAPSAEITHIRQMGDPPNDPPEVHGTLTLIGGNFIFVPLALINHIQEPGADALALTGVVPTVTVSGGGETVAPPAGSLALTGVAPSSEIDHDKSPGVTALALASAAPVVSVESGDTISVPSAQLHVVTREGLQIQGQAPSLAFSLLPSIPPTGTVTFSSDAPVVNALISVPVPATNLALTGVAPLAVQATQVVLPTTGSLEFTSVGASLEPDALVLTGYAPTIPGAGNPSPGFAALTIASDVSFRIVNHIPLPTVGALAFASTAPTVAVEKVIVVAEAQDRVLASDLVTISTGISVPAGSLGTTGNVPGTGDSVGVGPVPEDALSVTGAAPSAEITHNRAVPEGSLALTGNAPFLLTVDEFPSGALVIGSDAPFAKTRNKVTATQGTRGGGGRGSGGSRKGRARTGSKSGRTRTGSRSPRHKV